MIKSFSIACIAIVLNLLFFSPIVHSEFPKSYFADEKKKGKPVRPTVETLKNGNVVIELYPWQYKLFEIANNKGVPLPENNGIFLGRFSEAVLVPDTPGASQGKILFPEYKNPVGGAHSSVNRKINFSKLNEVGTWKLNPSNAKSTPRFSDTEIVGGNINKSGTSDLNAYQMQITYTGNQTEHSSDDFGNDEITRTYNFDWNLNLTEDGIAIGSIKGKYTRSRLSIYKKENLRTLHKHESTIEINGKTTTKQWNQNPDKPFDGYFEYHYVTFPNGTRLHASGREPLEPFSSVEPYSNNEKWFLFYIPDKLKNKTSYPLPKVSEEDSLQFDKEVLGAIIDLLEKNHDKSPKQLQRICEKKREANPNSPMWVAVEHYFFGLTFSPNSGGKPSLALEGTSHILAWGWEIYSETIGHGLSLFGDKSPGPRGDSRGDFQPNIAYWGSFGLMGWKPNYKK